MQINGRTFVVTGGGNGMGREVVLQLLGQGARVAALDLRAESLEETTRLARSTADRLSTHVCDVSDRTSVDAAVDEILATRGVVDGLLNIAGIIQPFVRFNDLDLDAVEKVMNVNFWGVVNTTKALLPHLISRPEACLVNVSSMGGFTPVPGQAAYGASKAAVKLLTEALHSELRETGVRVTVVFPGAIQTDISAHSGVQPGAAANDGTPGGQSRVQLTSAADAARAIITGGISKGHYRVLIGKDAKALDALSRVAPQRATEFIATKMASLLDKR